MQTRARRHLLATTSPRRRRRVLGTLVVAAVAIALGWTAAASRNRTGVPSTDLQEAGPPADRPRLVVMVMIDQFRADYVSRYGHQWSLGLRRMLDEGSVFPLAAYPYATTVTCAGHATVATGALPSTHGIVGNSWFDRAAGRTTRCTFDAESAIIDYGGASAARAVTSTRPRGESARRLRVPTLADELRAQLDTAPRVVTMASKQRSAIMLAGRRGDAVTWLDTGPAWTTSRAFTDRPVPFVAAFVNSHSIDDLHGEVWSKLLPDSAYLFEDESRDERPPGAWSSTFPHPLEGRRGAPDAQFYRRWQYSPFSDDYLGAMARAAVEALELGQRRSTDLLGIGFSSLDFVGHQFGPRSHEVQDTLARLDRTLGTLLDTLDRRVGRDRYVVALSSDHGVSPIPEWLARQGMSAGRIRTGHVAALIEAMLDSVLGSSRYVARVMGTQVYFRAGVYERIAEHPLARSLVTDALRTVPGIDRVVWRDELAPALGDDARDADPTVRAVALGHDAARSGDVMGVPAPYWIQGAAASHGSPHLYDRRVPVMLLGAGIRPGHHLTAASPADIAPTLARLTGVTLPAADGRVLDEALAGDAGARPSVTAGRP